MHQSWVDYIIVMRVRGNENGQGLHPRGPRKENSKDCFLTNAGNGLSQRLWSAVGLPCMGAPIICATMCGCRAEACRQPEGEIPTSQSLANQTSGLRTNDLSFN